MGFSSHREQHFLLMGIIVLISGINASKVTEGILRGIAYLLTNWKDIGFDNTDLSVSYWLCHGFT